MSKWLVAFTVMLPTVIEIIDTSIVNISLEHIAGALSASVDQATWAITSYLVSNAIIIPISGWLSRQLGRKNLLMGSILLFTVSSFMCGSAWSLQSLIFFRILQGIGGGSLQPLSQSILLESFPREQHGMAMALFGVGIMFGPIIGPLLGGWITDNWSWRWIFYINVPIGILAILMTFLIIYDPPYMKRQKIPVDFWGLGFLAVGLGSLQFVLDKGQRDDWFSSNLIITFAIIAVVALGLLILWEIFADHPVINLRLFKDRTFTTGNLVMFAAFVNLFGSIVLLPIFLQSLMGYTATQAGLILGPGGFATMLAMPIVGLLITRMNPKWLLGFGVVMAALATYMMSLFNLQTDFWTFIWPRVVLGVGMGALFVPLTTITLSHLPKEHMTEATSLYNLLRNIGGSVGVAFATTMLARRAQFHQVRLTEHLTPLNTVYQVTIEKLGHFLHYLGIYAIPPEARIYAELMRQVNMLAFNDTFYLLSIMMLSILPLIFIMKRPGSQKPPVMH